ncbi:NTP transferase domain-containing protein, partial [Xanthomonas vasicola]
MRAIILAAGTGSRLRAHTELPKCLLKLADRHLIQHQIDALSMLGIDDIHVILGYRSDDVARVLPPHVQPHLYPGFGDTKDGLINATGKRSNRIRRAEGAQIADFLPVSAVCGVLPGL